MSFSIWPQKPPFTEADLTSGEKIYQVGQVWVVTNDPTRATQAAVDAVLNAPPLDISDINNLDKVFRAFGLLIAQYTGKTPATVRADFTTIYKSLP